MILSNANRIDNGEVAEGWYSNFTYFKNTKDAKKEHRIEFIDKADGCKIDPYTLKHSFDNGATWYGEDEIRWALSLLSNITPRELEEAIEAKSKSCGNCKYHSLRDMNGHEDLEFGFSSCEKGIRDTAKDFCCNKHEPKIIKALEDK